MPQTIIHAERVEKYYAQPSANRIQVIAPTDLSVASGEILALLGSAGSLILPGISTLPSRAHGDGFRGARGTPAIFAECFTVNGKTLPHA